MTKRRKAGLAERILRDLEKSRHALQRNHKDLARDMVELNVLRTFGAAVSEQLDRTSILAALDAHMPRLFDHAVLLALVDEPLRPELHVFPRRRVAPELMRRTITATLEAYSRVRNPPLPGDVPLVMHEPQDGETGKLVTARLESHITFPLMAAGEHAGCLSIAQIGRDAFDPLKVQLFSLVAYQLGAALRNSFLLAATRERAVRDGLTGLFNRRYFSERCEEEVRRAKRYRHPVGLIMADIDHFKELNDRHGHQFGDRALQLVAGALDRGARDSDVVCRYGGEEFAILLPEASVEEGAVVAERLCQLIPTALDELAETAGPIHMSFGVAAMAAGEDTSADALIGQADEALYMAKRTGRNRVCVASSGRVRELHQIAKPDKRRFPRVDANLKGSVQLVPDLGDRATAVRAIDLSSQGVRLVVESPLPQGAFVLVELEHGERPLRLLTKVVWTSPHSDGTTLVGARILAFDATSEHRVKKLIDRPARARTPTARGTTSVRRKRSKTSR